MNDTILNVTFVIMKKGEIEGKGGRGIKGKKRGGTKESQPFNV